MRGGLLVMPVDDADSQREKRGHASRSPAPKKDTTKDMRSPQFARKSNVEPSGSPFPPLSSKKGAHGRSSSETNTLSNIDENTSLYLNPSPHRHHFAPQPLTPSFLLESDAVDDAQQQAMEILASLTSLGISTQLRQRVQEALSKELDKDAPQQSTSASGTQDQGSLLDSDAKPSPNSGPGIKAKSNISSATIKAKEAKEAAIKKQMTVEELEKKLTLSRSIMRKLYHKTVHLEKEVQLLKANSKPINDLRATGASEEAQFDSSSEALRPTTAMSTHSTISSSPLVIPSGIGPVGQAIQERDRTISQLQQALDASRRRCALLESQTPASSSSSPGSSKQQQQAIADLMAQSSLHLGKYKQIRDDYNSLLFKRSGAISSSKIASQATKDLVEDMQARLAKEIEEREAEAALYSSRLYESERAMADLYIEKKGLQDQVAKLNQDISHRDRLDAEIEACVCTMFERTRLLEEENASLNARLNDKAANSSSSAPSAVLGPPTRSPEAWPSVSGSQQGTVGQSLPPSVSAIIAKEKERVSNEQGKGQVLSLEDTNNTIATNNPREGDPPQ